LAISSECSSVNSVSTIPEINSYLVFVAISTPAFLRVTVSSSLKTASTLLSFKTSCE